MTLPFRTIFCEPHKTVFRLTLFPDVCEWKPIDTVTQCSHVDIEPSPVWLLVLFSIKSRVPFRCIHPYRMSWAPLPSLPYDFSNQFAAKNLRPTESQNTSSFRMQANLQRRNVNISPPKKCQFQMCANTGHSTFHCIPNLRRINYGLPNYDTPHYWYRTPVSVFSPPKHTGTTHNEIERSLNIGMLSFDGPFRLIYSDKHSCARHRLPASS